MAGAGHAINRDQMKGGQASRRSRRMLLLSSALATALAGLLNPGAAQAACVESGPVGNPTALDCSGASAATSVTTDNSITVTTDDDTDISGGLPLSVVVGSGLGGGDITLNNIGGTFTATSDGISLVSSGAIEQATGESIGATIDATGTALSTVADTDISLTFRTGAGLTGGATGVLAVAGGAINISATGGTFSGGTSDGLTLIADGDITVENFAGSTTGGQNGLFAQTQTGTIAIDGFTGSAEGTAASAIFAQAVVSGDISIQNFSGIATADQNGIFALTPDGNIDISGFSGSVESTSANGIYVQTTNSGDVIIQNFSGSTTADQNGILVQTTAGNIDLSGFSGAAASTSANGMLLSSGSGDITADDFLPAAGTAPYITGAANGMLLTTDTGNISVQNFASSAQGGQYGLFAQAATSGDINLTGFSGSAEGTAAGGIFALAAGGSVIADDFSGSAVGDQYGIYLNATGGDLSINNFTGSAEGNGASGYGLYGEATGTITLGTDGAAVFSGTTDAIFLRQMGGDVQATLGGTTQVTGASVGLRIGADAAATGNVVVETGADTSVSGDVAGIRIDKTSAGGNVSVTANGTVASAAGTGIVVNTAIDAATETVIAASGPVSGAIGGIAANTASTNGSADSFITTDGTVSGGTGTAVLGYATATGGDASSRFLLRGAITDSVNGVDASAIADGAAVADVQVQNAVTVTGFGVRAVAQGTGGSVSVATTADGLITADGTGIDASAQGNGMTATVTTDGAVTAGGSGIVANLVGDDGAVEVTTNAKVTAGVTGIQAGLDGTGGTVKVTNTAEIEATGDGIVASNTGGDTTVSVQDLVTAGGTVGVSATAGGDGTASVDVIGNVNVTSTGTGVLAQTTGTGAVVVNLYPGQMISSGGIGIRTAQAGDSTTAITTAIGAIVSADTGQTGFGNAIRADSAGGVSIVIGASNIITGAGKSSDEAVIRTASVNGTGITVGEGSLVSSWSYAVNGDLVTAASDMVLRTDGGAALVSNEGTIVGRVVLSDGNDTFNNLSSNSWVTVGTNNFGAGTDTLNNPGRIVTALQGAQAEYTSFDGLETFVNGSFDAADAGLLTMSDEVPGQIGIKGQRDVTYVSGVFVGQGNSRLAVDAALAGPGATSDVLRIGGLDAAGNPLAAGTVATQGQTAIVINDVSRSAGGYNPNGILAVQVDNPDAVSYGKWGNQQASFVISSESANYDPRFGGVIDKGLFVYDLAVRGNDTYIVSAPDREAFELPKLVTAAQSIWHETTGGWLDRQADLRDYLRGSDASGSKGLIVKARPVTPTTASITPGVWAKAVGSWSSRDSSNAITVAGHTYGYDTGYGQNTYGFIAGADFGKEGVGSSRDAVMFGVLGGYVTSDVTFDASPTSANYSGGTVGAYATYLNQNWFIDGLFKADFLSMDYKAPTLGALAANGQSANVTNVGFTLDTGYRYKLAGGGFFEPIATLSYVSTSIDNLPLLAATEADFGSNDSLRLGVGARIGGALYNTSSLAVEANLNARLWYEFLADNTVALVNPGAPLTLDDDFSGAFGEIGGGFNVFAKDSGWNGFTNASFKFADGYIAGSARGGVRYQW